MPSPKNYPEEIWGIEDPRITFVPELQQYVVTYTSYSRGGPGVSLALTKDFRTFERYGVIMSPDDKDSALLPRRINGCWALIHRPMTTLGAHMWISYSPDLRYWGRHRLMLEARRGAWWDANKIGLSPPPIETSEDGSCSITGCGIPLRAVCIDWAWPFSIWRIRKNVCCVEIRGFSVRKPSTSAMATLTMLCFPADTPWTPMATPSTSTTERPIVRLPWLGQRPFSAGWLDANGSCERRQRAQDL